MAHATVGVLKKEHKNIAAKAVSLAISSPEEVMATVGKSAPRKFTADEAIAIFIVQGKQTKSQYQTMRMANLWKGK